MASDEVAASAGMPELAVTDDALSTTQGEEQKSATSLPALVLSLMPHVPATGTGSAEVASGPTSAVNEQAT